MIKIKSPREIKIMQAAGSLVAQTLAYIEQFVQPGISTYELDQLCEKFILKNHATPNFKGYQGFPNTICSSKNNVLVHGIPSKKDILKEGDIITVDVGCQIDGYHGDGARTFPVGKISDEIRQLLTVTEASLHAGIEIIKPGITTGDISYTIGSYIKPYGYGIPLDYTGHGIGRDLHEDPPIFNDGIAHKGPKLKAGMVVCIEPMVQLTTPYTKVLDDGWTVVSIDGCWSAHFEHMVAILPDGYQILTK